MAPKGIHLIKVSPYKECFQQVIKICNAAKIDDTHGAKHALQIFNYGCNTLQGSGQSQQQKQVLLACLMHDIDDLKYFNNKNYQNALSIIKKLQLTEKMKNNILKMIDLVSYSKNLDHIDQTLPQRYYYPRYADRIQTIGAVGLCRAYQYGKYIGNPLYLQSTPKPNSMEQLHSLIKGRNQAYLKRGGTSESIIDHLFDKLLHIQLPNYITNAYLRSKYQEDLHFIKQVLLECQDYSKFEPRVICELLKIKGCEEIII